MTTPTDPDPVQSAPATPAPRKGVTLPSMPVPNFHNVASVLETVAFIVAATLYLMNNGADQNHAVASALFGAIFHAYNH